MYVTDLGGHSGCKILLCEEDDNRVYVRKIASDENYNERLKLQADKQASFKSKTIKTPAIYARGYTNEGLYYFDMEYIQGITMAEYIQTIEIGKVRTLVEAIVRDVVATGTEELAADADEKIFKDKICDLKKKLEKRNDFIINEAIDMLMKHSWKRFKRTACHGDLTLENIIVKDGQLYLIDFLDSFYDCWIMDISTLMQDVQTLWSYRFQEEININTLIRLIVFRDILMDKVKQISKDDEIEVYYALLLKLIRIFPYTQDEYTYEFLIKKTVTIMEIIRNGGAA